MLGALCLLSTTVYGETQECKKGALIDGTCYSFCQNGLRSDPDFDGFGWEDGKTCLVRNSARDPLRSCIGRHQHAPEVDIGYAFSTYSPVPVLCQLTTDQDRDLLKVAEYPLLKGSCERHYQRLDPRTGKLSDRFKRDIKAHADLLRCGKMVFIYGGYEIKDMSIGMPENLVDVLLSGLKPDAGDRLENVGFFKDPFSDKFPLGLSPSPREQDPTDEEGRKIVMSCATCHLGKTPDGRFVVGMPNEKMDIGRFNNMIYYALYRADQKQKDPTRWPEKVQEVYHTFDQIVGLPPEQQCEHLEEDPPTYRVCMAKAEKEDKRPELVKMLDVVRTTMDADEFFQSQGMYLPSVNEMLSFVSKTPGSYNPIYPSFSVTDRQVLWTPGPIWEMTYFPIAENKKAAGSIFEFDSLEAFVKSATYATYSDPRVVSDFFSDPVVSYLRTLYAPKNYEKEPEALVQQGKQVFQASCVSCHNGPDGETTERVELAEIGAPETFRNIFLDYTAPNPPAQERFDFMNSRWNVGREQIAIHSRKLTGIWSRNLFMLNGAVHGLHAVFCLGTDRPKIADRHHPYSDASHLDLCEDYTVAEKKALISYLKTL